jgi:hypothetical protein
MGILPAKEIELICIALVAACTSLLAIPSCSLGVPILLEEAKAADVKPTLSSRFVSPVLKQTVVKIVPLGYPARCTEPGCANLGRLILRYADAGGRPVNNPEFCHAHSGARVASAGPLGAQDR